MIPDLLTTSLTPEEERNTHHQLSFISHITKVAKKYKIRIIVSGGFAVDGALGKITRPHEDIDIQLYGSEKNGEKELLKILTDINPILTSQLIEKPRSDFYSYFHLPLNESIVEFYYLQITTNPFSDEKIVVKKNGTTTQTHKYDIVPVTLNGISFEAQDPVTELADRIYKRDFRGDPRKTKHEQDIYNLSFITDKNEVEKKLNSLNK